MHQEKSFFRWPCVSLVATKTGSMFHRAECPVVAGRPDSELRKVQLPAEGMAPCKLCSPLEAPA